MIRGVMLTRLPVLCQTHTHTQAVKWGRNVNDNIRKFLQFQFTVNVVLLVITFVGAVRDASKGNTGKPPLAAIHLLWANLIMDTMAALALSTENPNEGLLKKYVSLKSHNTPKKIECTTPTPTHRPPTYRDSPLINRRMWRFVFGGSVFQLAVMLTMMFGANDLPMYADIHPTTTTTPPTHRTNLTQRGAYVQLACRHDSGGLHRA